MNTHPNDLSELERRLVACQPSAAGLDADAMLFAAGRASVRPGRARYLWPALTAGLAAFAMVLGTGWAVERGERLALLVERRNPAPPPTPLPPPAPPEAPTAQQPASTSVLSWHTMLEHGLDDWPPPPPPDGRSGPSPDEPVLRVGRLANLPNL
jgi:hypothetical protein